MIVVRTAHRTMIGYLQRERRWGRALHCSVLDPLAGESQVLDRGSRSRPKVGWLDVHPHNPITPTQDGPSGTAQTGVCAEGQTCARRLKSVQTHR